LGDTTETEAEVRRVDRPANPEKREERELSDMVPTGGVPLSDQRLRELAPQWEAIFRDVRRMDQIELGEREPFTLFVWKEDRP
jgi:hypothetical protein